MSKFNIGVGEDFPLDEGREKDRGGHRGRRHCRHHRHRHHDQDDHLRDHLAAMAMLFALKAYRRRNHETF